MDYNLAYAFCDALSHGNAQTEIFDFRAIHDQRDDVPVIPIRGTLAECWDQMVAWNETGYGIFCAINRSNGEGIKLRHFTCIRAHFVDLDDVVNSAYNLVHAKLWSPAPSFVVHTSKNKHHVYWPCEPYMDAQRFTNTQRRLIKLFNGDVHPIDVPRVMRLPGTVHHKGEPYLCTCHALPECGQRTTIDALETALADIQIRETSGKKDRVPLGTPELAAPSLQKLMLALNSIDPNDLSYGEWFEITLAFKQAGWSLTDPNTDELFDLWSEWCAQYEPTEKYPKGNDLGQNISKWRNIKETELGWKFLLSKTSPAVRGELLLGKSAAVGVSVGDGATEEPILAADPFVNKEKITHYTVAMSYARQRQGYLLFDYETEEWLEWNKNIWKMVPSQHIKGQVADYCYLVSDDGAYKQPQGHSFWSGVVSGVMCRPEILTQTKSFNSDRYLLNYAVETKNLQTGEAYPHDPKDRITKMTRVSPGPSNGTWPAFVRDIFNNDEDTVRCVQTMFGSTLSGGLEEEIIIFLSGTGRNGKGKFIETIKYVMGNYAGIMDSSIVTETKTDQHPTGMTDFAGLRLAIANEADEGKFFNVSALKKLSGDEEITARRMAKDNFTFERTSKLVILGNDQPQLRSVNPAIKARMRIIPFMQSYVGREDPDLADKLKADGPGVLQWLIDGHAMWLANNKRTPVSGAVKDATDEYFASQSTEDLWLEECAVLIPDDDRASYQCPTASELYDNFRNWKRDRGESVRGKTRFSNWLKKQSGVSIERSNGSRYRGIRLLTPFDHPNDPSQTNNVVEFRSSNSTTSNELSSV